MKEKLENLNNKNEKEKFMELINSSCYENPEYIVDIMKMLNKSSKAQEIFNKLSKLENTNPITKLFIKMEKSLDKLLEIEDYEYIKEFIKLYTETKYNEKINLAFSKKIYYKRSIKGILGETIDEHPIVRNIELKLAQKLIEYSQHDYENCMKFIKKIPEFFISENQYGNNYYMRREVLPEIMGVKEILDVSDNVNIDSKTTLGSIIGYLNRKKSDYISKNSKSSRTNNTDSIEMYKNAR